MYVYDQCVPAEICTKSSATAAQFADNTLMKERTATLDCSEPGVMDLMYDSESLEIWEYIRASQSCLTTKDITAELDFDMGKIRQAINSLLQHGLLKKVRQQKSNTTIGYKATADQIVISFDEHETKITDQLIAHSKGIRAKHFELVSQHADPEFHSSAGMRFRHSSINHFTKNELAELRRRLHSVIAFLNMPRNRNPKTDEDAAGDAPYCNQAVSISLDPMIGRLLPTPTITTTPRSRLDWWDDSRTDAAGLDSLTPREREAALAIADGLSRAQAADQLGITANTVSTLLRRAYKKIGVSSQAELAARLAGYDRPLPGDDQ